MGSQRRKLDTLEQNFGIKLEGGPEAYSGLAMQIVQAWERVEQIGDNMSDVLHEWLRTKEINTTGAGLQYRSLIVQLEQDMNFLRTHIPS